MNRAVGAKKNEKPTKGEGKGKGGTTERTGSFQLSLSDQRKRSRPGALANRKGHVGQWVSEGEHKDPDSSQTGR